MLELNFSNSKAFSFFNFKFLSCSYRWEWVRKNLTPAFSNKNIHKRLPQIQQKTAEFTAILDQHIAKNKPLNNFTDWMLKLTIDLISTTMFDCDFKTISGDESILLKVPEENSLGMVYLTQLPITIKV